MQIKNLNIDDLEVNKGQLYGLPKNPRFIRDEKFEALKKSIEDAPEMLSLRELLVYPLDNGKFIIIGGNMRYRACKDIGYKEVPCKVITKETPVAKLREYAIKDNNEFGQNDWDILANEWDSEELAEWGLQFDWETTPSQTETQNTEVVEDDFDEEKEEIEPICKRGDIWKLGKHRLMCGDSTIVEEVLKLMDGEKADCIFIDPPYDFEKVEYTQSLDSAIEDGHIFVMNDDMNMVRYLKASKFEFKRFYVADFRFSSPRGNDAYLRHILVSHEIKGNASKPLNLHDGVSSIINMDYRGHLKDDKTEHKHQKSLTFIKIFLTHYPCSIVLDIFGGSGSTMMACEQLDLKCLMMELDEHYCDVIIARWEKLTGQKANKI